MPKKEKVTAEERIEAARACAEGRISITEAARKLGVDRSVVPEWVLRYSRTEMFGNFLGYIK